jgi:hypothetical protein
MDSNGNAVVVLEGVDYDTGVTHIYADRFTAGAWGATSKLDTAMGAAKAPQVAVDGHGDTIAVWYQNDGSHENIYYNIYGADT